MNRLRGSTELAEVRMFANFLFLCEDSGRKDAQEAQEEARWFAPLAPFCGQSLLEKVSGTMVNENAAFQHLCPDPCIVAAIVRRKGKEAVDENGDENGGRWGGRLRRSPILIVLVPFADPRGEEQGTGFNRSTIRGVAPWLAGDSRRRSGPTKCKRRRVATKRGTKGGDTVLPGFPGVSSLAYIHICPLLAR